ncbi:4-hydroxythreonine-4-phosphate dehydrogenase PdxA [Maricaulis sp.]|uniref:4-hydroxythreonine-4-phosphate dehydrogenase PdxA n=1 Tax=Maricaulis sp. TaxID=1486257 RepID=UPI00261FBFB4|nr:4-hydroxythreonine-4-phosphate dehydrogenase PdxA [Maricaulis sp.]
MRPPSPIVVSMGDPAGIGPEIILKAYQSLRGDGLRLVALGDHRVFSDMAGRLGLPAPTRAAQFSGLPGETAALPVLEPPVVCSRAVEPGRPDAAHAGAVKSAIETGVSLCRDGRASALVTAPISKAVMYEAGFDFPGHTEFLADLTADMPVSGPRGPAMMLSGGGLRVVLVTIHLALRNAIEALSPDRIATTARLTDHALRQDFGIAAPRLALAGLNPHAGEGGALGEEERRIVNPAAAGLRTEGIDITDALPPDTMFHAEARTHYDAAVCLYHDQGLIPVKTLDFDGGVNITLGLPIVRTSPDHGTAFPIAGQGKARPDSLIAAIREAAAIAERRG